MADKGQNRSARDKQRAAYLKARGDERTSGRCATCYRIVTVDSRLTRYTHICWRRR